MARYLIAGGMGIAARPTFEGIGVHWTLTLLGCIPVLLVPRPLIFWKYGAKLRGKSKYAKGDKNNSYYQINSLFGAGVEKMMLHSDCPGRLISL
jgi:hypothetical protein